MKKQIPIFIAGSKTFRQQRLGLKAMANDLNAEYNEQRKDILVQMYSYENFGDHQQEYNQFIADVSQLVIFVLDGNIGQHTEDEFRLAVAELKKENSPKILVFLKEFQERTPGIQHIEQLLEEAFGPEFYYLSYSSTEDLCNKAKERIQQYVRRVESRRNLFRRSVGLALVFLMLVATFATAHFFANPDTRKPTPTLIFVGGGSAANVLKSNSVDSFDVRQNDDYKMIYINTPSTQGYGMLHDEVKERHALGGNKNNNLFYPICLSATQAHDSCFLHKDSVGNFLKHGIILSYLIGRDTLEVYSYYKKGVPDSLGSTISTYQLTNLLRNDSLMVYTTNATSGTYIAYEERTDTLTKLVPGKRHEVFYASYDPGKELMTNIDSYAGYLVLGSRYYHPDTWDTFEEQHPGYCLRQNVTLDTFVVAKPVYVYMVAYSKSASTYTIPEIARRFLQEKLGIEDAKSCTLSLKAQHQNNHVIHPIGHFTFTNE